MGTKWFGYTGESSFWRRIPLLTTKKAFFKVGGIAYPMVKMVVNSITYDFEKTAAGGAVIVPPGYSAMEFISPDGRVDYNSLLSASLGTSFTSVIRVLESNPIPAWDKCAAWLSLKVKERADEHGIVPEDLTWSLETVDGTVSVLIDPPLAITTATNMVDLLSSVKDATAVAHGDPLSMYRLDNAAFGWVLKASYGGASRRMGFLFRE